MRVNKRRFNFDKTGVLVVGQSQYRLQGASMLDGVMLPLKDPGCRFGSSPCPSVAAR